MTPEPARPTLREARQRFDSLKRRIRPDTGHYPPGMESAHRQFHADMKGLEALLLAPARDRNEPVIK